MKRYGFALFCLLSGVLSLWGQYINISDGLTLHGTLGYSRIAIGVPEVSAPGGWGAGIGVGYEWRYRNFILRTGADFSQMSSVLEVEPFRHTMAMFDTNGRPYDGIFDFEYNREQHRFISVAVPVMAGGAVGDFYFLGGFKFLLGFGGNITTSSEVDYKARYDMIVGSDGDGLLTDLPNHGLTTVKQSVEGEWVFSPVYQLSVELGKVFHPVHRQGNARHTYRRNVRESRQLLQRQVFSGHTYRVSLFCDYGLGSMKKQVPATDPIVNLATNPHAYKPALQHTLYSADRFNTLFTGVKLTVFFQFNYRYSGRRHY